MANKVLLKRSSIAGKAPVTSDLDYGELSINYADGVLYYKNSNNNIGSFLSNGSSFSANVLTANVVSTGTVTTTGNINSSGNVIASGNVSAAYFQGNAVSVTGLTLTKSLGDVVINSPSTDQVLAWNGTRWVNATSNVPTVSTVFASSAYDMGFVYDADITVFEDEGLVTDAVTSIYDLGILSFTGIISLNNLDSSVRNDYVGFSIIFGF